MTISKENVGGVLFFAGAITFFAYPEIVKMNAKKHPELSYDKMTTKDKFIMGAAVASFLIGGAMFTGILKTQSDSV